ncbi:MAG: class I SAM-dependent methyltransferase [Bryobacteraceae bacterium]
MNAQGFVDVADVTTVSGWAWSPDAPYQPVYVDLYDGELLLARLRADLYRKDLAEASRGDGCHAFQYTVDEARRDGCEHEIRVCFEGTGIDLTNSPCHVLFGDSPHRTHELACALRAIAPVATWNVDLVESTDGNLALQGWALPSLTGQAGSFAVNGAPLSTADQVSYPLWRPDVADIFWFVPHSARSGFACSIDWRTLGYAEADILRVDYVDAKSMSPWDNYQAFYLRPGLLNARYAIPPEESILRVAGYTSAAKFLLDGYTTLVKLQRVVEKVAGRSLNTFSSILDWGCGCGRLTRHLIEALEGADTQIVGIDIDHENVQWCKTHLPRASFDSCELDPPTNLPAAAFDLIIGLSVFTHLDEATQFAWLDELKRVAMPGALLLLSVHGNTSVCRSNVSLEWLDRWRCRGIDDSRKDPALSAVINNEEYYRATFHTKAYVQERWTTYFDVVTIIDGFLSNNQDLVVLRAR